MPFPGIPTSAVDGLRLPRKGECRYTKGLIALGLFLLLAVLLSPRQHETGRILFLTPENLTDILRQISEIGIIAVGMTFVILSAGIDLSVGSLLALSASLCARLLTRVPSEIDPALHIAAAVLIPLLLSTGIGCVHGLVIARLEIRPFVVTLAGMIGIRGLARSLTGNANIDLGFGDDMASLFAGSLSRQPVVIGLFLCIALLMGLLLRYSVFGLRVRSLGDNSRGARYAGIPVTSTLVLTYGLSSLLCGIAGIVHAAQNHQGSPNDGVGFELDAIAAVVIGGTWLSGGKGSIPRTMIGVLVLGILSNIFRLNGVDANAELMVKAVIIILAVWSQKSGDGRRELL